MSTSERWDVVIQVLGGPLSGMGEQTLRGPVVRVGSSPGPGGLALTGYHGLDARHAVITCYDGGAVTIGAVGTCPVRLAPNANVDWRQIDPIRGPQYLNAGGVIHLGPLGRGCTLRFVRAQRLGEWGKGNVASAAGSSSASPSALRVGAVRTSSVPTWFIGCALLLATGAATVIAGIAIAVVMNAESEPLGPQLDDEIDYFARVPEPPVVDEAALRASKLTERMQQPFSAFVMADNARLANRPELVDQPELWDERFYLRVTASIEQHVKYWSVFKGFDRYRKDYATVLGMMRKEGLPEVFAAIPVRESNYRSNAVSSVCAAGFWQFMPEVAWRLESRSALDFKVRNCRIKGENAMYSPEQYPDELAPPHDVAVNGRYMRTGDKGPMCGISACDTDARTDLRQSTAAAVVALREALEDPALAASGAAVQIAIASHNAGYDDKRFGRAKTTNLRPAFTAWAAGKSPEEQVKFWGSQLTCGVKPATPDERRCGDSKIYRETQFYVDPIVMFHTLAVCYYAQNYADVEPEFQKWANFLGEKGYCRAFRIPSPREVGR